MKEKVKLLFLFSILFSCIWLFALIHLNNVEQTFPQQEEIILVEIDKEQILYDKQVEFFENNSIFIANKTKELSDKYDIPVSVIYALIETESDGINGRVSKANCVGLTQVSEHALKQYNCVHDTEYTLLECKDNISINLEVGVWYYDWCIQQVKETKHVWQNAYLMFNVGYGNYKRFYYDWIEGINPFNGNKYSALTRFKNKLEKSISHFSM